LYDLDGTLEGSTELACLREGMWSREQAAFSTMGIRLVAVFMSEERDNIYSTDHHLPDRFLRAFA
jgi:hypothetical protein